MSDQNWPDLSGRLVKDENGNASHTLPIRVYFEDTDFSGLVYHASYVRWCERGRSDFLRLMGTDHRNLIDGTNTSEPAAFVVRHMSFDFRRPARIDEILEVVTRVGEVGAASLDLRQTVMRDNIPIVHADVKVVLVSMSGKPMRISQAVRSAFSQTQGAGPEAK